MTLETNANIPTPYVYKPADFTGILDARAEAAKNQIKQQKEVDKGNAKALAVDLPTTTEAALNADLLADHKRIVDTYSKLLAEGGGNLNDLTSDLGRSFDADTKALQVKYAEYKRKAAEVAQLESFKSADPLVYDYYQKQIAEANRKGDNKALIAAIDDFTQNKTNFVNVPNVLSAVQSTIGSIGLDKTIDDIANAIQTNEPKDKILTLQGKINDEKIPQAVQVLKQQPDVQAEQRIFEFKKSNDIQDPKYGDAQTFDEYLTNMVADQAALRQSSLQQYRDKGTFNFNVSTGGAASPTGQIVSQGRATGARTGLTFSDPNVTYDDATGYVFVPSDKGEQEAQGSATGNNNVPLIKEGNGYKVKWSDLHNTDAGDEDIMTFTGYDSSSKDMSSQKNLEWTTALKNGKTGDNSTGGLKTIKLDQMGNLWAELGNGDWALLHSPNSTLGATKYTGSNALNVIKTVYGGKVPAKINVRNNQEAQNWLRENYTKLGKKYDVQ